MCRGYSRAKPGFELRTQGQVPSIGSAVEGQFLLSPSRWTLPLGKSRKNAELVLCSNPQQTQGLPRVLLGAVSVRQAAATRGSNMSPEWLWWAQLLLWGLHEGRAPASPTCISKKHRA